MSSIGERRPRVSNVLYLIGRQVLFASRLRACVFFCALASLTIVALSSYNRSPPSGDFYVAVNGSSRASGTRDNPWDLATALAHPKKVRPGDTIWVRGGTYRGSYEVKLKGLAGQPIVVRAFPRERVKIDFNVARESTAQVSKPDTDHTGEKIGFFIRGDNTQFRDFEFTNSQDAARVTKIAGSHPSDITRGSVEVFGAHNQIINAVVHDLNKGIGLWASGAGGEIYGCTIFSNGWEGPDRLHGSGIYAQNYSGVKRIVDNVIYNQYGRGLQVYGSASAQVRDFHIEGNVVFNSGGGIGAEYRRSTDIIIGGGERPANIAVVGNYTFQNSLNGTVYLGWGADGVDLRVENNFFASAVWFHSIWEEIEFTNNTVLGANGSLITLRAELPEQIDWNHNTYYSDRDQAFDYLNQGLRWEEWREVSTADSESTLHRNRPDQPFVVVRPNNYEEGRAVVVVYNWQSAAVIAVDLSEVLSVGDEFWIFDAVKPLSSAVMKGSYDGGTVNLNMRVHAADSPIGAEEETLSMGPDFHVFLVRRQAQLVAGAVND